MKYFFFIFFFTSAVLSASLSNPTWSFSPSVAEGTQFDAQAGPNNLIHLISSNYYQLDLTGNIVVNEDQGEEGKNLWSYPPAIAVGEDGSAHIITRSQASGDDADHDIRYRRRNSEGNWDRDYIVGGRASHNRIVGIGLTNSAIIMSSTERTNDVWGNVNFWKGGEDSASFIGSISDIWRADADNRLRGQNDTVYLVSGRPEGGGAAYFSQADTSTEGIRDRLVANMQTHDQEPERHGFPDLALDGQNYAHFAYGAASSVYYNKYDANGAKVFADNIKVFGDLVDWGLDAGLSAIAVSESGEIVVIVALDPDDEGENDPDERGAMNCDLLWAYSTDGGETWSNPQDTGHNSDTGEGRRRPRLVAIGDSFVLLYGDTQESGISMGVLTF